MSDPLPDDGAAVAREYSGESSAGETHRRARRRPGENRERLLEAGIREFGTRGYHGASTTAIAALAEVPQPHVYANFGTKQELFIACAERVCEDLYRFHDGNRIEYARFLYQAVAAVDDELRESLLPLLLSLRSADGVKFDETLIRAAASLLTA